MNQDGSMARRKDLEKFAMKHNFKIGTIADLIHYRSINEKSVEKIDSTKIKNKYGELLLVAYKDNIFNQTHLVLVKGKISSKKELISGFHVCKTLKLCKSINSTTLSSRPPSYLARIKYFSYRYFEFFRWKKDKS